ncbi:MAG: MIP/aquaporin family protein [Nocardioidaceae bacterium]
MKRSSLFGELCAEFAGTMILLLFGLGVVAQVVLSAGTLGDHNSIAWAWGFGVTLGVYVAARISGGHLNPAVTVAFAIFSDFPWRKVLPYSLAQTLGAFVAALIVRALYADLFTQYDPKHTVKSQFVFSTMPGNGSGPATVTTAFFDQIVGTAILMFLIFALIHAGNNPPLANLGPLIIGFIVVAIGMAWGANAGYAINPARDFGPRLAEFITGFSNAWQDQHGYYYFWVPIVAPIIGAIIGGALFKYLIGNFLPTEGEGPTVGEAIPNSAGESLPPDSVPDQNRS